MTFDPKTNRIPFGLMTNDETAALKNCGGPWVVYHVNTWHTIDPSWMCGSIYRQATPAIIPASVDWSCFGPDIVAVAADKSGDVRAYEGIPKVNMDYWWTDCYTHPVSGLFPAHAYIRGADIWQNSLVVRP
jgi:hypothetical protein